MTSFYKMFASKEVVKRTDRTKILIILLFTHPLVDPDLYGMNLSVKQGGKMMQG